MNNFIKYPQGGGGDIDVTSMLSKDNLVSIGGLYFIKEDDKASIVEKDLLNHDNNFNNIENRDPGDPIMFNIKFKNISFQLRNWQRQSIIINRNIFINVEYPEDPDNYIKITIDIIDFTDPAIQTNIVTGKYYFTNNQVHVDPGTDQ